MASIDLNSDLGENSPGRVVSDDAGMLAIVTSANVSCGFHAGTPAGIRETLSAAVAGGVVIGAHPSYRDAEGFGRRSLDIAPALLQREVEEQIATLSTWSAEVGGRVAYVKPHGALYNTIVHDQAQANAVVAAVRAVDPRLVLLGLTGSAVLESARRAGLTVASEAFADRAYLPDGQLVPRAQPGAVLHDAAEVAERMLRLVHDGTVAAIDGTDVPVRSDSICVHGDSPGSVALAAEVRRVLAASGVQFAPFVR